MSVVAVSLKKKTNWRRMLLITLPVAAVTLRLVRRRAPESGRTTQQGFYLSVAVTVTDGISFFFFSSRRRHTRSTRDWSSDVCSSDLSSWAEFMLHSNVAKELWREL